MRFYGGDIFGGFRVRVQSMSMSLKICLLKEIFWAEWKEWKEKKRDYYESISIKNPRIALPTRIQNRTNKFKIHIRNKKREE